MPTVLFTGDRNHKPEYERAIKQVLRDLAQRMSATVIVGDCPTGVDKVVRDVSKQLHIPCLVFKAEWKEHGKKAGPMRNGEMVEEEPDICIAVHSDYPNSKGTKDCATQAMKAGITTVLIPREADFALSDYEL